MLTKLWLRNWGARSIINIQNPQRVKVIVAKGPDERVVAWCRVQLQDCYLGVPKVPRHITYHGSGEQHLAREKSAPKLDDPPALVLGTLSHRVASKMGKVPLTNIRSPTLLGFLIVGLDEESLKKCPIPKGTDYKNAIKADAREFKGSACIHARVTQAKNFFDPEPVAPGFRTIIEFRNLWIVIDIFDSVKNG